jgi:lipopolysaccharide/colanic/teichoic acid biosynthesis glycosyltransferase
MTTPARSFPAVRQGGTRVRAGRIGGAGPDTSELRFPAGVRDTDVIPRSRSVLACRVLNVTVALFLLGITLPVWLVVSALIRLTSPGPVFYTQTRVGLHRRWNMTHALHERRREDLGGAQFTIFKFRTMRVDAEADGRAQWAVEGDPRVTPIGRVLRATRIDELPQLLNVLRGDMNVVGPRPERPSIFVRLREEIVDYQARQRVRPGITGWAQVNRSYDTDVEGVRAKVALDLEYLRRQSVWTDLGIMLRTVPVVLFRVGGW